MRARGDLGDRPWGVVLAGLARIAATGELIVRSDGREVKLAFERGVIIAADSPLVSDSVTRIALLTHLITAAQVSLVSRRLAAVPERDPIDVLAELVELPPELTRRLRQRVVANRAARTFGFDRGDYVFDERHGIAGIGGCEVDVRPVLFHGIRLHLSEERLAADLRRLGTRFRLLPEAGPELRNFGLTQAERPILERLQRGASLAELDALHRDIDPRTTRAAIYALVACGAAMAEPPRPPTPRPSPPRTPTPPPPAHPTVRRTRTAPITGHPNIATGTRDLAPIRPDPQDASTRAADAFARGMRALHQHLPGAAVLELVRACELAPEEYEYLAALAWARFCAADDRHAIAADTRKALEKAARHAQNPATARFYLGRVERMLGRDREALRQFREVLAYVPAHPEAAAEIRVIEARLTRDDGGRDPMSRRR